MTNLNFFLHYQFLHETKETLYKKCVLHTDLPLSPNPITIGLLLDEAATGKAGGSSKDIPKLVYNSSKSVDDEDPNLLLFVCFRFPLPQSSWSVVFKSDFSSATGSLALASLYVSA